MSKMRYSVSNLCITQLCGLRWFAICYHGMSKLNRGLLPWGTAFFQNITTYFTSIESIGNAILEPSGGIAHPGIGARVATYVALTQLVRENLVETKTNSLIN